MITNRTLFPITVVKMQGLQTTKLDLQDIKSGLLHISSRTFMQTCFKIINLTSNTMTFKTR